MIIGATLGITYLNVVELFKEKKLRGGYTTIYDFIVDGSIERLAECYWFSTLQINGKERERQLNLTKTYTQGNYQAYDNYPAIDINSYKDIPTDYQGLMGVPASVLLRNWPEDEYEIVDGPVRPKMNGRVKFPRVIIRRKQL